MQQPQTITTPQRQMLGIITAPWNQLEVHPYSGAATLYRDGAVVMVLTAAGIVSYHA